MRRFLLGLITGLAVGMIIGAHLIGPEMIDPVRPAEMADTNAPIPTPEPDPEPAAEPEPAEAPTPPPPVPPPAVPEPVVEIPDIPVARTLTIATTIPRASAAITAVTAVFEGDLRALSQGKLGAIVNEHRIGAEAVNFKTALSEGTVDALFLSPTMLSKEVAALGLYGGFPFGPAAAEYLAWYESGPGRVLHDKLYDGLGLHALACGMQSPRGGGWFRKEIASLEDLKGMRIAIDGPAGWVLTALGAAPARLDAAGILTAFETSQIDGAFHASPVIDQNLGFDKFAGHYYLPGWHRQTAFIDLAFAKDTWGAMDPGARKSVEAACAIARHKSLAASEAAQFGALVTLQARGTKVHQWPADMLRSLSTQWVAAAASRSAVDPTFAEVWQSLDAFRKDYGIWRTLSHTDPG